jgi:glutathione S-transferase
MYQVIGTFRSRTLRVLWMLEELGLPYEHIQASPHSDVVKKVNPNGKIPVLVAEGAALTDSSAILTYLADKHGGVTFPAGTIKRARQDGLLHKSLDEVDAALWLATRHTFYLPEYQRMPEIKGPLVWEFSRTMRSFEDILGDGPFLMGNTFTIPDIVLTHCLGWAINAKFPVESDNLRSYIKRCRGRDAFKRAAET